MTYRDLYTVGDMLEKTFQKDKEIIANYSVDVIPDDHKINVVVVKRVPVKRIRCTVSVNC